MGDANSLGRGVSVIHYHGTGMSGGNAVTQQVIAGRHAFASFSDPAPLEQYVDLCSTFALDNGAFSAWKGGKTPDWEKYYDWVRSLAVAPNFDWAVIPDVINGSECANDSLLDQWPLGKFIGVPVWHIHESLGRLSRLADEWPRIALGSSGKWSTPRSSSWWNRMGEAMDMLCDRDGRPKCKLHGLRMLDPAIFSKLPLASADSTNVARNICGDKRWERGTYPPGNLIGRGAVLANRIEAHQSAQRWKGNRCLKLDIDE